MGNDFVKDFTIRILESTLEELNDKVDLQSEMKDLESAEDPEKEAKNEVPVIPEDT